MQSDNCTVRCAGCKAQTTVPASDAGYPALCPTCAHEVGTRNISLAEECIRLLDEMHLMAGVALTESARNAHIVSLAQEMCRAEGLIDSQGNLF